jgi:hypothetical protein
MAKTVATIDGDSSGLVSELDQAKKAMGDLGTQGKKLSDQLREVADEADVAAGNLVNKIGGPAAVKAIAGVGIAFGAAQKGAEMFLDSSEKLFRSYGQEGQAVWDDLEKSLNSIQGGFAKAVLQTDDMYVAAGRLYAILEGVKTISDQLVDAAVGAINLLRMLPGTMISSLEKMGLFEAFDKMSQEGEARARELVQNMDKSAKAFEKPLVAAKNLNQTIDEMVKSYAGLTGSSENYEEQQRKQALAAIDNTVKQVEALALLQNMADNMSGDNIGGLTDAQLDSLNRLGKLRQEIEDGAKKSGGKTGSGAKTGRTGETAEQRAAREAAELQALYESNNKLEDTLVMDRLKALDDRLNAETERKKAAIDAVNAYALQMEAEHDAEIHARGELTVAEQEKLNQERLQAFKDRAGQELGIYMQNSGKMLAIGELSAKEAADMARQQLGNIIMGYGDKAMAEAGIMAASLNPLAVPMAAAGVAAYAIGSTLSADKKSSGTTPSTEKPADASTGTTNYAFNLRVDSAFADGESIARKFAQMQEAARQRGLLTAGAY